MEKQKTESEILFEKLVVIVEKQQVSMRKIAHNLGLLTFLVFILAIPTIFAIITIISILSKLK